MALGQPKFREGEPEPASDPKKVVKKSGEIIAFPSGAKGAEREGEQENERWAADGILSKKQYREVLLCVAEGDERTLNRHTVNQANLMAGTAGITLSPEAIAVYGVLRLEKPGEEKKEYQTLSDQRLLAEALLITGDTNSREVFVRKSTHIFLIKEKGDLNSYH